MLKLFLPPAYVVCGKVIFSVCLSVHRRGVTRGPVLVLSTPWSCPKYSLVLFWSSPTLPSPSLPISPPLPPWQDQDRTRGWQDQDRSRESPYPRQVQGVPYPQTGPGGIHLPWTDLLSSYLGYTRYQRWRCFVIIAHGSMYSCILVLGLHRLGKVLGNLCLWSLWTPYIGLIYAYILLRII